jgi:hypothetical protein
LASKPLPQKRLLGVLFLKWGRELRSHLLGLMRAKVIFQFDGGKLSTLSSDGAGIRRLLFFYVFNWQFAFFRDKSLFDDLCDGAIFSDGLSLSKF